MLRRPLAGNEVPPAEFLLILNKNENIVPAVARLDRAPAPAYFMLGETTGTPRASEPGQPPVAPAVLCDRGRGGLRVLSPDPRHRTLWAVLACSWPASRRQPMSAAATV